MNTLAPDTFDVSVARIDKAKVKLDVQELDFFYGKTHSLKGVSIPIAEKAVTALGNNFVSFDMNRAMSALPLSIFSLTTGSADQIQLAWSGALLISVAVLGVTIVARWLSREPKRG